MKKWLKAEEVKEPGRYVYSRVDVPTVQNVIEVTSFKGKLHEAWGSEVHQELTEWDPKCRFLGPLPALDAN
jgi:hypothetical protein